MDFIEDTQTQSVISKVENLVDDYSEYLDSLEEYIKNTGKQKSKTTVQPKSKKELVQIIEDYCEENGWDSDLNFIDTSLITDMSYLFCDNSEYGYGLGRFNGNISKWDVSSVKNMISMFECAEKFNQPLNNWDVSNVEDMDYMFSGAFNFNQSLNNWDVSNVEYMEGMFLDAKNFNQPIGNWDVSNVEEMMCMFEGATSFNQPLNNWDVSSVKNMERMFEGSKLEKIDNLPDWYR
jgi:surface protein